MSIELHAINESEEIRHPVYIMCMKKGTEVVLYAVEKTPDTGETAEHVLISFTTQGEIFRETGVPERLGFHLDTEGRIELAPEAPPLPPS